MNLKSYFLIAATLSGVFLPRINHAQTPKSIPFPAPREIKQVVSPDTPQNVRLVDAVRRGDLAGVQASLRAGASADTRVGWEGSPGYTDPVAFLAAQNPPEAGKKFLPIFRLLVRSVTAVNAADEYSGRTLLMTAVDMGDLDSVKHLIEKGADLNARTKLSPGGETVLTNAVMLGAFKSRGVSPVTRCLLEHGAQADVADANGATPMMLAAELDKIDVVRALLAAGADPARRDKFGRTAMRWAAIRGWDEIVALLHDRTPMDLYEAAQFGDVARLRAHLDAGEDANTPHERGTTLLMAAMKSGSVETARLLLDHGADVNKKQPNGVTALHLASLYGDTAMTSLLLDRGADINAGASTEGEPVTTPLTNAVKQAQADVVALLLKRGVDVKGRQGVDAFEVAIREAGNGVLRPRDAPASRVPHGGDAVNEARSRVIDLLLEAGVDVRSPDSHALFLAADGGQAGLIELLLSKGANINGRGVAGPEGSPQDGQTALMGAIGAWAGAREDERMVKDGSMGGSDIKDIREAERFGRQSVELLLSRGADVNLPDARGTTPLMECVSLDLPEMTKMLLAHGAKIDAPDSGGASALMRAAAANDLSLAAQLLARHANINLQDKKGRTPLMLAVDDGSNDLYRSESAVWGVHTYGDSGEPRDERPNPDGHPKMVSLLLRNGASINLSTPDGATALSLARKQGFQPVVALLIKAGAKR